LYARNVAVDARVDIFHRRDGFRERLQLLHGAAAA
jgi:hypothetical protein